VFRSAAAPLRLTLPHQVDDHRPHGATGVTQKMSAVFDAQLTHPRKPQVGLVHERRGVEDGITPSAAQSEPCQPSQVVIRRCEQGIHEVRLTQRGGVDCLGQVA
jgi:hypothetical protein